MSDNLSRPLCGLVEWERNISTVSSQSQIARNGIYSLWWARHVQTSNPLMYTRGRQIWCGEPRSGRRGSGDSSDTIFRSPRPACAYNDVFSVISLPASSKPWPAPSLQEKDFGRVLSDMNCSVNLRLPRFIQDNQKVENLSGGWSECRAVMEVVVEAGRWEGLCGRQWPYNILLRCWEELTCTESKLDLGFTVSWVFSSFSLPPLPSSENVRRLGSLAAEKHQKLGYLLLIKTTHYESVTVHWIL